MANPVGLALGALVPELVKTEQLLSAAEADATLLLFMSISAATTVCILVLLWCASSLLETEQINDQAASQGAAGVDVVLRSPQEPRADQIAPATPQSKADNRSCCMGINHFTADVLPQLVKLLRTPKLILVAVSFAFLVAPMLAAFGGVSITLRDGQMLYSLPQQILFAAFIVIGAPPHPCHRHGTQLNSQAALISPTCILVLRLFTMTP